MTEPRYPRPIGEVPDQTRRLADRAVFTHAYALIPRGVMRDIVTSQLPHWRDSRAWILARPLSGFAETFSQLMVEIQPGGGSDRPEPDPQGEGAYFVMHGQVAIELPDRTEHLEPGGFAWMAPGERYRISNPGETPACVQWIRKAYEPVPDIDVPASYALDAHRVEPVAMDNADGLWRTTRLIDPEDMGHDMHINIVTFEPGGRIPFAETHVMEHGLYVLEGSGVYYLNGEWVEVEAGDFMWLRAFCPQACYASGQGPFRYLLYKDVNRHPALRLS